MSIDDLKARVAAFVDTDAPELIDLSLRIHAEHELGHQEFKSSQYLVDYLRKHGFAVETGTAGLPTAFKAMAGGKSPRPLIAFLAEYDALPEVGHACGHNIIGTSAAGAGAALASLGETLPGSTWVLGTPAEETSGGKVTMVNQGIFNSVDAVLMDHPTSGDNRMGGTSLATHGFTIQYHGKPSHAAASPTEGINALDAASIFLHAMALLRQHVPTDVRLHGIITKGGDAANIIPDFCEIRYLARAEKRSTLNVVVEKIRGCIHAGAAATGCTAEVQDRKGYEPCRPNTVVSGVLRGNMEAVGYPPRPGLSGARGSTDLGNVSRVCPQACANVSIAPTSVAGHSREMAQAAASPEGHRGLVAVTKALAWSAIDLMCRPGVLEAAWEEFRRPE